MIKSLHGVRGKTNRLVFKKGKRRSGEFILLLSKPQIIYVKDLTGKTGRIYEKVYTEKDVILLKSG